MQRGFAWLVVPIVVLVIVVFVGGVFYLSRTISFKTNKGTSLSAVNLPSSSTTAITSYQQPRTVPSATLKPATNWKTYTSSKYKFSIKYPGDWTYELGSRGEEPPIFQPVSQPKDQYRTKIGFGVSWGLGSPDTKDVRYRLLKSIVNELPTPSGNKTLELLEKITTDTSLVGYKVKWSVENSSISDPIKIYRKTYFDLSDEKSSTILSINFFAENEEYLGIYNDMIRTFSYVKE